MRHPSSARTKAPAIVRRMAGHIVRLTEGNGTCTSDDLRNAGFTAGEISAHGHAARDLAAEQLRHLDIAA